MTFMLYDTIIIGAGPGGMTAGIYAARRAMKTLVLGDLGGQMAKTLVVENHPAVKSANGLDIAMQIQEQAKGFGVEFEMEKVKKINSQPTTNNSQSFEVICEDDKKFLTKSIILAFGLDKRKLGLDKEKELEGRGLSYCITCDGPMFKNKPVAIVGGGNAGAEAVEFMAKICPKVYWLEMMETIRADKIFQDKISKLDNVEVLTNTQISELKGEKKLEGIKIKTNEQEKDLDVEGVFVEIGYISHSEWLGDLIELDSHGQIKTDKLTHTNIPGIFAVGDCTDVKYKQIVIAEGEGAIAALEAYEYINQ